MRIEILIFDGLEDLDVFGPMSVLSKGGFELTLVAGDGPGEICTSNGVRLAALGPAPTPPDMLVVPGGGWITRSREGAFAEAERGVLPALIAERFDAGSLIASVCTGGMLVAATGLLKGRPAITNQGALDDLRAAGAEVMTDARVVDDGQIVTAGGITAGIDLGLWLIERELGPAAAVSVATQLEYKRNGYVWRRPTWTPPADTELPHTRLTSVADALARSAEPTFMYYHSVRSYMFAGFAAQARGLRAGNDYDDELLFLSCVLHDIGLTPATDQGRRFEIDGADAAFDVLVANGLDDDRADVLWQAIALHSSPGIPERRGHEIALTRAGIGIDFGIGADVVPDAAAAQIHDRYPRLDMARSLTDAIVAQAHERPQKALPYTLAGELVRERAACGCITRMEQAAATGRWGSGSTPLVSANETHTSGLD